MIGKESIYLSLVSLMFSFILLHNAMPNCQAEHEHQHSWLGLLLAHHNHSLEADLQIKQFLPSCENQNQYNQEVVKKQLHLGLVLKLVRKRSFNCSLIRPIQSFKSIQWYKNIFLLQGIPDRGPPVLLRV